MQPTNRLAHETSPYLLQHAHNPVDWYPWGPEAIERARSEDRPLFLSVGYSACHWCHVMERESFENPAIAALMNELFVNINVDREERPDLDELYMQAVQLFSGGHGGWPMSVFLTPALEPFFGGTYFPPADRHGMPGFPTILRFAAGAYRDRPADVQHTTEQVVAALRGMTSLTPDPEAPGLETIETAMEALQRTFDPLAGGFGGAPKFPPAMSLSLCLRAHARTGAAEPLRIAAHTLRRMARGGIHDQLGGGFHRYATDARWLIPHFEKMLYDNALLCRTYVEAWQVTRDPLFRSVAEDTIAYLLREMRTPDGAFAAAQDADTNGVEGQTFVWTPDEIAAVLGAEPARIVCRYYGVEPHGNFEHGTSVLSVPDEPEVVAGLLALPLAELTRTIDAARMRLLQARQERPAPARDDKVIVAWNGLTIAALAIAGRVFGHRPALEAARAAAAFILDRMGSGPLFRTFKDGRTKGLGFLDDHAALVRGLLELYEATCERRWLDAATALDTVLEAEFEDPESGGFFYTGTRHEELLARSRQPFDNATPSGNALHAGNLARLAALTGNGAYGDRAEGVFRLCAPLLRQAPSGMAEMLCGLDFRRGPVAEVVVSGGGAAREAFWRAVHEPFAPRKVVAGWPESGGPAALELLTNREAAPGTAQVYVCRQFTCQAPVTDAAGVRAALETAGVLRPAP